MKFREESNVLTGMPSLLSMTPFPHFQCQWPLNKELPPLNGCVSNENDESIYLEQLLKIKRQKQLFEPRKQMQVTECEHKGKKHYAKNMCSACYHNGRKINKTAQCGHSDRRVFARNMCCSCYSSAYKNYVKNKQKKKV